MERREGVRRRLALAQVPRHNGLNEGWRMEERARMTRKDQIPDLKYMSLFHPSLFFDLNAVVNLLKSSMTKRFIDKGKKKVHFKPWLPQKIEGRFSGNAAFL